MQLQETTLITATIGFREFEHVVMTCRNSPPLKGYPVKPFTITQTDGELTIKTDLKKAAKYIRLYFLLTGGVSKIKSCKMIDDGWEIVGEKNPLAPPSTSALELFLDEFGENQNYFSQNKLTRKVRRYLQKLANEKKVTTIGGLLGVLNDNPHWYGGCKGYGKMTYDEACRFVKEQFIEPLRT